MKKISGMALMNLNSYLNKNGICDISLYEALSCINTGKTKYDVMDLTNALITGVYNMYAEGKVNDKRVNKYLQLLYEMGNAMQNVLEDEETELEDDALDEVMLSTYESIPDVMRKYYSDNNLDVNEELINSVISIGKTLGVSFDSKDNQNNDKKSQKILELNTRVSQLEKENARLNQELESALKEIKKSNNSSIKSISKKDEEIKSCLASINELEKEIKRLKDLIEEINAPEKERLIGELNSLVETKTEEITRLNNLVQELTLENGQKDDRIATIYKSEPYIIGSKALEDEEIDKQVLLLLTTGTYTAEELYMKISENRTVDLKDIYASLKRISYKVNIENPKEIVIPKRYTICKPKLQRDMDVLLSTNGQVKKMLLVSDFHLDPDEDINPFRTRMESLQSYADANGIDTIVNLGDFFGTKGSYFGTSNNYFTVSNSLYGLLGNAEKIFNPNITHLVLGGNHDETFTKYGVDSLSILNEIIPSVISVGYSDAILNIGNKDNRIGLHHSGTPRQSSAINPLQFARGVVGYLDNYYQDKKKSYFDFFGHVHTSVVDPFSGFAIVPSLTKDRTSDGVIEADVYLNENGSIEYMVLYSLNVVTNNSLRKVTEIPIIKPRG